MAATTKEGKIADALLRKLAALTFSPAIPVSWPNVPFAPTGSTYLEAALIPNENTRVCIGHDDPVQRQGLLQVTVVAPNAGGVIAPMDIAGAVVAHFASGTRIDAGTGIDLEISEQPSVTQFRDESALRVPVTIPYRAFA